MANEPKKPVIFVHIPKTGGSTLRGILEREYGPDTCPIYNYAKHVPMTREQILGLLKQNRKAGCFYGHFGYGMWLDYLNERLAETFLFPEGVSYISFVRDPFDFVISYYYYTRYWGQVLQIDAPVTKQSLEEFIRDTLQPRFQTLYITGGVPDVELAKKRIRNQYRLVGVTDLFKESVFLMKKEFGWKTMHYHVENKNPHRPPKSVLSRDMIRQIEKKLDTDLELYDEARRLIREKIESLDAESMKEWMDFRNHAEIQR